MILDKILMRRSKIIIFSFLIILIILFFVINIYLFLDREIKKSYKIEEKIFEVKKGEKVKEIAFRLEKENLIKNKFYFLFYVLKEKKQKSLQAGRYFFSNPISIFQIVEKISKGEVVFPEVKITFLEGLRLSQIESLIQNSKLILEESKLISDFKIKDFKQKYIFLKDSPDNASLEGFLFPDTYYFKEKTKIETIINKFLSNFNKKLSSDLIKEIERQNKTIFEIIIMASILEKEAKTKEDWEIVSGIFWKRIKQNKPLESCATIAYILGVDKWRYSYQETRIPSPYNTYLNQGLPQGPISNPGLEAIKAAIYPKETDYNYFLTDPETKKTIFAETIKEHNENKIKYFK